MSIKIDSSVLCIAPWNQMEFQSNGDVVPCCQTHHSYKYGNLNQNSQEMWNSPNAKKLRKQMLNGEKPDSCSKCYESEMAGHRSSRHLYNYQFSQDLGIVDQTMEDGGLENFRLKSVGIRFSNLCNFSCRSCNPTSSTSWYKDSKSLGIPHPPKTVSESDNIKRSLAPHLSYLEWIYFAGGEPLMHKGHYELLEDLIIKNRSVSLTYDTNMSVLSLKDKNVLKLWKYFEKVFVSASIDGVGKKGEMIRTGMDYKKIVNNLKLVKIFCPHITLTIAPTISVLNVFHIVDAFREWIREDLIAGMNFFSFNMLTEPAYYNISILNAEERIKLENHYNVFFEELNLLNIPEEVKENITTRLKEVLKWLKLKEHISSQRSVFHETTISLNKLRNEEDWFEYFPEHIGIK